MGFRSRALLSVDLASVEQVALHQRARGGAGGVLCNRYFRLGAAEQRQRQGIALAGVPGTGTDLCLGPKFPRRGVHPRAPSFRAVWPDQRSERRLQLSVCRLSGLLVTMRRIFITGASSGIGLLAARALCARGHLVWGTSRALNNLPAIERFHPVILDLNTPSSIE